MFLNIGLFTLQKEFNVSFLHYVLIRDLQLLLLTGRTCNNTAESVPYQRVLQSHFHPFH